MEVPNNSTVFFDDSCPMSEQLPRNFSITFSEIGLEQIGAIKVILNDSIQVGDILNDNAHDEDFYRYHDIFHYTFATLLHWSPCSRSMLKRKRKSNKYLDEIEDGARATITEESLSLIIFNEAKRRNYYKGAKGVSNATLRIIKDMTANLEAKVIEKAEWEYAILKAYEVFRLLIANNGGRVQFDLLSRRISYSKLN